MPEKRDIKRHNKRYSVRFGIDRPERLAFTEDISTHGLFIKTTNITPIGKRIQIEMFLPDNESVFIEGMVRWSKKVPPQMIHLVNKSGMGVKILRFIGGEALYRHLISELHVKV